jgi:hypothetical protein
MARHSAQGALFAPLPDMRAGSLDEIIRIHIDDELGGRPPGTAVT